VDSRDLPLDAQLVWMRVRLRCGDEDIGCHFSPATFVHGRLPHVVLEEFHVLSGIVSQHLRVMLPIIVGGIEVVTTSASLINYMCKAVDEGSIFVNKMYKQHSYQ
jgi:hypothetical protein